MKKTTVLVLLVLIFLGFQNRTDRGLKDVFKTDFLIGTAVNFSQVNGAERGADSLVLLHFNSLTPENGLKWALVHPEEDKFDFLFGDAFVQKGEELEAFLVGHTLVWHQQTPKWVFEEADGNPVASEVLRRRMENHIAKVVGRYKGKIHAWDVVNEAFEDNGTWRKTPWYSIMGPEFIELAFRKAQEIDPEAKLIYNDYNVWRPEKLKAILTMALSLKEKGVKIDGIGMQGHYRLNVPSLGQIENAIVKIHEAGLEVHITELDVDVLPRPSDQGGADLSLNYAQSPEWNPFPSGLPNEVEKQLVERYSALFGLFKKHSDKVTRVTLWGLHDGVSWLNNWPVKGRTNYPLLFDREKRLRPGFLEALSK
jgi:endo-1,4-beta-xylanase